MNFVILSERTPNEAVLFL